MASEEAPFTAVATGYATEILYAGVALNAADDCAEAIIAGLVAALLSPEPDKRLDVLVQTVTLLKFAYKVPSIIVLVNFTASVVGTKVNAAT